MNCRRKVWDGYK